MTVETKDGVKEAADEAARQMADHLRKEQAVKVRNYRALNRCAKKGQILFTGSSLMEQFPVTELAAGSGLGQAVYNRGIGGTTTEDFLREIDTVLLDLEPSTVFINIGTNDIRQWEDGRDWMSCLLANYEEILRRCKNRLPGTRVYVMAYYPVNPAVDPSPAAQSMLKVRTNENIRRVNRKTAALAARYGYEYIDVNDGLTDADGNLKAEYTVEGVHMYAEAYEIVYRNLLKYLQG